MNIEFHFPNLAKKLTSLTRMVSIGLKATELMSTDLYLWWSIGHKTSMGINPRDLLSLSATH